MAGLRKRSVHEQHRARRRFRGGSRASDAVYDILRQHRKSPKTLYSLKTKLIRSRRHEGIERGKLSLLCSTSEPRPCGCGFLQLFPGDAAHMGEEVRQNSTTGNASLRADSENLRQRPQFVHTERNVVHAFSHPVDWDSLIHWENGAFAKGGFQRRWVQSSELPQLIGERVDAFYASRRPPSTLPALFHPRCPQFSDSESRLQ